MDSATFNLSSWRPTEEFPGQLLVERTWLVSAIVVGIGYGIELILFFMCLALLVRLTGVHNWKSNLPITCHTITLFSCGTVFMVANAYMACLSFVDNRNFPGGPSRFQAVMFSIPINNAGNVASVIASWLANGLTVWRWHVVYRDSGLPLYIIPFIPYAVLVASVVLGICFLIQISVPTSSIWFTQSINLTLPYFWTTLILNFVSTIAIVSRLIYLRNRVASALGKGHGTHYVTLAAIIVESATLYSLSSLLFLVLFMMDHPILNVFLKLLSPAQVIASLLIVLRILSGRAWRTQSAPIITYPDRRPRTQVNPQLNESVVKAETLSRVQV